MQRMHWFEIIVQESKTINAAINRARGHGCSKIHDWKNVWQKATARVAAAQSLPVSGPPIEIKMDGLRKLEDAISRENEEDVTNLKEYFTKLLKEKQNQ